MIRGRVSILCFRTFLIVLLTSLSHNAFTQCKKTDSLITLFNNSTNNNEKLLLAGKIANSSQLNDSTIFLNYTQEVLNLSKKVYNKFYEANAYYNLGNFYCEKNLVKALGFAHKSLSIFNDLDSLSHVAMVKTLLGGVYYYSGNYSKAYEYFLESLKINEKKGNKQAIGSDYNNLAIIFLAQKDYKKALDNLLNTYKYCQHHNNLYLYPTLLINMSISYSKLDSTKQGLRFAQMAYDSLLKNRDAELLPHTLLNLSESHLRNKNISKAEKCLAEAEVVIKESGSRYYMLYYLNVKGNLLNEKRNYPEAIKAYKQCLTESQKEGNIPFALDASESLIKIFKSLNEYKEALHFTEICNTLSDSITNSEKTKKITELELQYKFDKQLEIRQKEEVNQKKLLQLQRKIILFSIAALVFAIAIVILTIYSYRTKQKSYTLLNQKNIQIQKQSDELKEQRDKLQQLNLSKDKINSIIAHDLKNQFNSMLGFTRLIIDNWVDLPDNRKLLFLSKVDESTKNSFTLLNSLLEWSLSQTNSIKVNPECIELKIIADNAIANLDVQARDKRISIDNRIDNSVNINADAIMISSVIRNIVSNAIKFTNFDGRVVLSSYVKRDGYIGIEIQDNGVGISQDILGNLFNIKTHTTTYGTKNEKGTGLGLLICKDFVELNGGWIDVESELGIGTKFTITLPTC